MGMGGVTCGLFWHGCASQYFQTNRNPNHIQKYPFIYLISQKVDPFINSPPQSKFYKKPNSRVYILLGGGYKTKKMGASIPLISEVSGNLAIKYEIKIQFIDKSIPL